MFLKLGIFRLLAVIGLVWSLLVCPVFGAGLKQLHGHVPEAAKRLTAISRLPATNELHLAIGVPLRDPAGLDKFLADIYDPASPNYRHFLTPAEFTARFSATAADYAAVKNFALLSGFKITQEHGNRLLLSVTAQAGDVEHAFQFKLNKYQHPTEAREFFAPDVEPTVAAVLAVADVSGLSDFYKPHPKLVKMDPKTVTPKNGSAPDSSGAYFGNDFRNAYAPGVTLTGAGQQVGLFQLDGYYANDIAAYAQQAGGGRTNIQVVTVPVGSTSWSIGVNKGNGEVSLDIEMAMAMAPGLSKILVFEGPLSSFPNDILNAMAASNMVKNLSCSWGWGNGPQATTDAIFQTMAAQGQSFFNASGDSDAFTVGASSVNGVDNTSTANAPSSSPFITQVGGTTLTTGSSAVYSSETVWNWGGGQGGSGGVSSYYSIPSWQTNISMTVNLGSTTQRNIPDVALTADNIYVISGGSAVGSGGTGGTSVAAPLWAGFMALVNQQAAANGNPPAGFINPAIYAIGEGLNPNYSYGACFHDTTTGNNYWSSSLSQYPAVAGYDLCTGWGTPNGQNLINALAGPTDALGITPSSGFVGRGLSGGPFSPSSQVFTLTNSSASSFNWSVINPSAWLNVSAGSGTLAAAGQTTVTISLSSAANNLAVGNYSASVGFSNQTSHALQTCSFTLQIIDPLVLLTTNGFTAYGAAGGPFSPGSQAVGFTNLSASSVAWSLINTSSWLSASASSGSIAGNSSVSVTVATNAATANLTTGIYSATLVLSNQSSHLTQSLAFSASVGQNIVQNGGFETGDFTGWTETGDTTYMSVSTTATYVHTGTNGAKLGPSGALSYLSQTLATAPGQTYLLSFWLVNPSSGSGQQFQASWNGSPVYNVTSPGVFAWTNQKFIVTATGTTTTLQFGFENDPAYFGFDDISVMPVNPPVIAQQPSSQTNLVGSNVVFTAIASGTPPLAYQWRTNGVNLVNSLVVSGVATNVLTLTGITTTNAGNYTLVVTNACGSVTSSIATLTVSSPSTTSLQVTLSPAGAVSAGAQWQVDNGNLQSSGATVSGLAAGNHTVSFSALNGWTTPSNLTVLVNANLLTSTNATYVPVTNQLSIRTIGLGGISPNYSNAWLQIGRNYSITSAPATGFVFTNWQVSTNWAGGVTVTGTNMQFLMQSNLTIQANFIETANPSVSITNVPVGLTVSNAAFVVKGKASDIWQVTNVFYSINSGGWNNAQTANAWINWSATVNLAPGTNKIFAYAVNLGGNVSPATNASLFLVVTNQLSIRTIGLGGISPNYSNAWLQIGRNYSITSAPATGFVFTNWQVSTNWVGGVTVTGTNLQFLMQSNLTIQANFIETANPSVSITNVPVGLTVSNAAFVVKGKASDIWQVTNVFYSINSGGWSNAQTVNAWTNWSATVNLAPGTNTISAYAVNLGGNVSPAINASLFLVVTNQLSIRIIGLGGISPNYSNAWLQIGRNYSITSAPATGFVFTNWQVSTNWAGGVTVTGTNLQFLMQSNLTLQAAFNETSRPTLLITAPTSKQQMTNALATIAGTNSDNWGISGVWYRLNSNAWNIVTTTTNSFTNWTQVVKLLSGTNTVNAYAINLGGNYSLTNTVSFASSNTFALQLAFNKAQPLNTNGLVFSLQLSSGLNGHIQVSTNIASVTSWVTLTNFIGSNTVITFQDPGATNSRQRFYRAVIP